MVLDASAVVELLLGTTSGEAVAAAVREGGVEASLHAPDLLDVEVAQGIRRYAEHDVLTDGRAAAALELFGQLPVTRHPGGILLPRIWTLREKPTAYDAAYIALAEALDAPLLTCDGRLGRAPGHGAEVVVV